MFGRCTPGVASHVRCSYAALIVPVEHGLDACVAGFKEVAGEVQPMPSAAHCFAGGEALGTPVEDNEWVVHRLPAGGAVLPALIFA